MKDRSKTLTQEEFEKRITERAQAIKNEVRALEIASLKSCKDLTFDPPGGRLWLQNHQQK